MFVDQVSAVIPVLHLLTRSKVPDLAMCLNEMPEVAHQGFIVSGFGCSATCSSALRA